MNDQQPNQVIECSAVLFDMDGVLIDSSRAVERAWTDFAELHGLDPQVVLASAHGRRTTETLKAVAAHLDAEAEAARMESEEVERAGEVITLPGARDLLSALPRGTWGVVTSATSDLARARLEVNDLALPEVMVTAEDVRVGKPDPEGYVLGARLLGVAPKDCVVFEDAPPGIEAALRAGTRVVGVATTFSPAHLEGADLLVRSLAAASVETATHGRLVIRIAE